MAILKTGIDVSSHQGVIDWEKVKVSGVEFAMIRGGFGQHYIDAHFTRNISECNRLEIPVGVYWFSYALNAKQAKNEAEYCLNLIKDYRVEYPVAYDLEYDSINYAKGCGIEIDKTLASEMVLAFCGEVERQGYYAINYSNKDYISNMFLPVIQEKFDLWYALWGVEKDIACGLWQYSSTGTIKGINGNVDLNFAYKDYPEHMKKYNLNNLVKKCPEVNYKEKYETLKNELKKLIGDDEVGFKL